MLFAEMSNLQLLKPKIWKLNKLSGTIFFPPTGIDCTLCMIDIISLPSTVKVLLISGINKTEELLSLDIVAGAFAVCSETCHSLFPS